MMNYNWIARSICGGLTKNFVGNYADSSYEGYFLLITECILFYSNQSGCDNFSGRLALDSE